MPSDSNFPLELYEMIIDGADKDTLRTCLFVSMSFRHCARRHLFQRIKIEDDAYIFTFNRGVSKAADRLQLLVNIMRPETSVTNGANLVQDASPLSAGILPYIRHVCFHFGTSSPLYGSSTGQGDTKSQAYCVDILQMLRNWVCGLESLEICGLRRRKQDRNGCWSNLAWGVRSSLLDLCRSPSLDLTLSSMINVPRNILRGTTVRNIFVDNVKLFKQKSHVQGLDLELFPEYDAEFGMALLPLPNLQHAYIDNNFGIFCDQLYPVGPNNADESMKSITLKLKWSREVGKTFDRLSQGFSNLQSLSIWDTPYPVE